MWPAKSDASPDRSTKTQPCHSSTRTGFSPSVDLSKDSTSLKCGATIRLPSCRSDQAWYGQTIARASASPQGSSS